MSNCAIFLGFILTWFSGWGNASHDDLQKFLNQIHLQTIIQSYLSIHDNLILTQTNQEYHKQCAKIIPRLMAEQYSDFLRTTPDMTNLSTTDMIRWQTYHQILCRSVQDDYDPLLQFFQSQSQNVMIHYPEIHCSDTDRKAKIQRFFQTYHSVYTMEREQLRCDMYPSLSHNGNSLPLVYDPYSSQLQLWFRNELPSTHHLQIPTILVFTHPDRPEHTLTERLSQWTAVWLSKSLLMMRNPITLRRIDFLFSEQGKLQEITLDHKNLIYWSKFKAEDVQDPSFHTYQFNLYSTYMAYANMEREHTKVYAFYYASGY